METTLFINFVFTEMHLLILGALFIGFGWHMHKVGKYEGFTAGVEMTFSVITQSGIATEEQLDKAVADVARSHNIG